MASVVAAESAEVVFAESAVVAAAAAESAVVAVAAVVVGLGIGLPWISCSSSGSEHLKEATVL